MEEGLFHNPVFVNHTNEFAVAAVGHMEGHAERERVNPSTGAREQVCPTYGTIPCAAHQAVYRGASNGFEFRGVPASFITDHTGKQLFQISGQAPQQFIDKLNEAQRQIGQRPITGSQIARWMREVHRGDAKLAEGKFKDALGGYRKVADDASIPEFVRARAREKVEALPGRLLQAVEAARALPANQAKRELKKLVRDLKDFEEAKTAAEAALAELEGGG
ncbi:MAG: hypothetical protein KIT58_20240 [Planctomycetota bacterium]|nr:hypothetical protein [Planctomycetota bacterium]